MRVCITIGHSEFLLPNDVGLQALAKTLAKAQPILSYHDYEKKIVLHETPTAMTLKIEYVPDDAIAEVWAPKGELRAVVTYPLRLTPPPRRMLTIGS